jgi:histidine triad (HIT) family protein
MTSVFSKIINREIPAYIVAEDDFNIAILDINPLVVGHTLVIPKKEVDYYFDLDTEDFNRLNNFAKKVAKAIETVIPCLRIGVSIIGLEVPHTHVHLVPLNSMDDINFSRAKLKLSLDVFENTTKSIQDAFQILN